MGAQGREAAEDRTVAMIPDAVGADAAAGEAAGHVAGTPPADDPAATVVAPAADDPGATVVAPAADDPGATVVAPAPAPDDPGATVIAPEGEPPAPDDLPTIVVPRSSGAPASSEGPDGIDAMDDPYYMPAVPDDLTSARAPMSIPSPVQSLPERKRRLPRWAVALLVVILVAAAAGAARVAYDRELWGGKTVPTVVGMSEGDATQALSRLGFAVSVERRPADDDLGIVVACDPAPGTRADPAAGATIVVSVAREIPSVVGKTVDEAREALLEVGAGSILLTYRNSDQPSGTVLEVSPSEGSPFVSSDTITLTVARSYTVPNVVGMSAEEALQALADEGLSGTVSYVESSAEGGTVVSTGPAVGEQVEQGASVELYVASAYPSSPQDLLGYFDAAPAALADYLEREGFSRVFGEIYAASGNAHAAYANDPGDFVRITDEPEVGSYASKSTADVLRTGAAVGGVRLAFSSSSLPSGALSETESGVRAVMEACGLSHMTDLCTDEDAVMPEAEASASDEGEGEDSAPAPHFVCATGSQEGYTWAVFIGGAEDSTKVVALVAPSEHFSSMDLSDFGGGVCDYVAYANLYN